MACVLFPPVAGLALDGPGMMEPPCGVAVSPMTRSPPAVEDPVDNDGEDAPTGGDEHMGEGDNNQGEARGEGEPAGNAAPGGDGGP
eukprot:CAMPEP_0182897310 /NCGR_PEP_ID=MMETSP0034_2-20130328/26808_1 /TAXON_ID=156128 /ORGANISM="Nephroselmis pyriformis, Strain CCMP717" /LENGTH=85 /DNA_ID=CAMNT_0025031221 /DNA_START=88 /DNA_END=341 /DNA_ORIENTATION=-